MSESKKEIKSVNVAFRCTNDEKKKLKEYAERSEMSMGDFIISSCILKQPKREIAYLCRLQGLLNQLRDGELNKKEYIQKTGLVLGEIKWR